MSSSDANANNKTGEETADDGNTVPTSTAASNVSQLKSESANARMQTPPRAIPGASEAAAAPSDLQCVSPTAGGEQQKRKRTESEGVLPSWIAGASPTRFVNVEELIRTAVGVDNMALAHEIAIDPEFKLESTSPPEGTLDRRVHDEMHRAFWDKLQAELSSQPPQFNMAVTLVAEIKQTLLGLLLPQHQKLREELNESLDIDLLRQRCQVDPQVDFMPTAQFIMFVMSRLCAPARDEQLEELKKERQLIPLYKGIFALLDCMKLDMANYTINSIRPTVQENAVAYERQKFDDYLKVTPDGLRNTTAWLARAHSAWLQHVQAAGKRPNVNASPAKTAGVICETSASSSTTTVALAEPSELQVTDLICMALWQLLVWQQDWPYPETLLVDQARLAALASQNLQLCISTCVVMITCTAAGPDIAEVSEFRSCLKEDTMTVLEGVTESSLTELLPGLAEQSRSFISAYRKRLGFEPIPSTDPKIVTMKTAIHDLTDRAQPVRKLITSRVCQFVLSVIGSPIASGGQGIKLPSGLGIVQKELAKMTGKFLRIVTHNRQVFGDRYRELVVGVWRKANQPQ